MQNSWYDKIKLLRNFKILLNVVSEPTYYPEKERKNYFRRFYENLLWGLKHRTINKEYNFYGMDIKGSRENYLDKKTADKTREKLNKVRDNKSEYNHVVLLRDKYVFFSYLKSLNIPTPNCLALSIHGKMIYLDDLANEEDLFRNGKIFAKILEGERALGVKCISSLAELKELQKAWKKENYILQEKIKQHEEMNRICSYCVNTLRIITVYYNGSAHFLSASLRCGSEKSGFVDNFNCGGYAIGIKEDGFLGQYAYVKANYESKKIEVHPDSGLKFADFKIPFYKEAIQMICDLHRHFYGVVCIGWDVAITSEGPVVIEGNDNCGFVTQLKFNENFSEKWLDLCRIYNVKR